jgi:hypothetical protein
MARHGYVPVLVVVPNDAVHADGVASHLWWEGENAVDWYLLPSCLVMGTWI